MKKISIRAISKICMLVILLSSIQCNKIEDPFYKYELAIEKIAPTGGGAGTMVTITGIGFSTILNENKVAFNGQEAQISKATATTLIAAAPANGSTGKVTVTVNGNSAEGPVFTYLAPDQPQIISISPEVGWDYTINAVTINGKNFGNDQNKVKVTFDDIAASIQSFSSTKLIVSPPKHAAGKVDVVVKVDGTASNIVTYTYQIEPMISGIYVDGYNDTKSFFISVDNISKKDTEVSLTINGHPVEIDHIFREGTDQYQSEPVGDKVVTRFYVDQSIGYVSIMDFEISSNGSKSKPYRYVNEPRILDVTSTKHSREIEPGDTVIISGLFLGSKNQTSKIEIWDSIVVNHLTPDPEILSWNEDKIVIDFPANYPAQPGKHMLRMKLMENGKQDEVYFFYVTECPQLNEVYTGEYQYPNQSGQPYGIQLFADGTMDFSSSYDDYSGTYTYDCNTSEVTMDFAGHGVIVKAIKENNALTHFTFIKSSGFDFLNGDLNTTWNQNLDGTEWKLDPPQINSTIMSFESGNKVFFDQGQSGSTYQRLAGTIRFTIDGTKYFAVISGNKMEGENSNGMWNAEKQ